MAELTAADAATARSRRATTRSSSSAAGRAALQVSYCLGRLGSTHAVLSADDGAGRHVPPLAVLPAAAVVDEAVCAGRAHDSRAYERYDWNSLLADEPEPRAIMPELMDGTSYFPSRPEMEQNLATFAERTGVADPLRLPLDGDAARGGAGRRRASSSRPRDGEYRARSLVFAVGVAEPYMPATPGIELAAHYADTRPAETYAGKRVFIIGKQNSGFELASGLLPWARRIVARARRRRRSCRSTRGRSSASGRATSSRSRTTCSAAASAILDASIERHRAASRAATLAVRAPTDRRRRRARDRGRRGHRRDRLRDARCSTCRTSAWRRSARRSCRPQTPFWESASRARHLLRRHDRRRAPPGLKKHGIPANSGAVHGARYNARVLARHIARDALRRSRPERPAIEPADVLAYLLAEADLRAGAVAPAGLPRPGRVGRRRRRDPRDEGIVPLAHALDDADAGRASR